MFTRLFTRLNLHMFDGAGGEGGAAGAADGIASGSEPQSAATAKTTARAARNPLANVQYGKPDPTTAAQPVTPAAKPTETQVTASSAEQRKADFERFIAENKDLYGEKMQSTINQRFKETKQLETQLQSLTSLRDKAAARYGVDPNDTKALERAMDEDDSYIEAEADEKGLTKEQLIQWKAMERDNAELKRAEQERAQQVKKSEIQAQWQQQSAKLQQSFPNFNFESEINDPVYGQRFLDQLSVGNDVETAYKAIHFDDLVSGAMQYTAQTIEQKVTNNIRANGLRPTENGIAGNNVAANVKSDVSKHTKADRDEIERRVNRGERIVL